MLGFVLIPSLDKIAAQNFRLISTVLATPVETIPIFIYSQKSFRVESLIGSGDLTPRTSVGSLPTFNYMKLRESKVVSLRTMKVLHLEMVKWMVSSQKKKDVPIWSSGESLEGLWELEMGLGGVEAGWRGLSGTQTPKLRATDLHNPRRALFML